ncbi:hypothetical protein [Chitinimonas sp.]|uniref:hypothetical protein n=1 Tax=Chitinimonas sp. TaxID=1934313 RepID=UPI0035B2DA69
MSESTYNTGVGAGLLMIFGGVASLAGLPAACIVGGSLVLTITVIGRWLLSKERG